MKPTAKGACLLGLGIVAALAGRPAHAGDRPLLVVVEAPPALDADPAEIRRAIAAELGCETVAPTKTSTDPPQRALIVALDRERITMSLRPGEAAPVSRSIPTPPERAARLRAIVWLAGNLARDQVSPIVADGAAGPWPLATIPALASPAETGEAQPPPATRLPTEPPSLGETATGETPAIARRFEPTPASPARHWSIGVADGPTTNFPVCSTDFALFNGSRHPLCPPFLANGTAWRLELQHRPSAGGHFWGAAAEGTAGSEFSPQLIGASAFVGAAKRLGRWTLESTAGAGLELSDISGGTVVTATHSSTNGFVSSIVTDHSLRPALSIDGALAAAHPLWSSLDAVVRVGVHLSTADLSAWYLASSLGLRYSIR
jgi:hypothetical protein